MEFKVLFIGNSFTARNNVPELIAEMAEARGHQLQHFLIQAGGASLRMHWNKGEANQEIQRTKYDFVVLQEQSTLPVKNPKRTHENIKLFEEVIRKSGAKTALYLTWARQNAPETQQALTETYTSVGSEIGATIVPVGIAWKDILAQDKQPVLHDQDKQPILHDKDMSHPSLAGSYLAACVFFGVFFNESPAGISCELKGLTPAHAEFLQGAAWATVNKCKEGYHG